MWAEVRSSRPQWWSTAAPTGMASCSRWPGRPPGGWAAASRGRCACHRHLAALCGARPGTPGPSCTAGWTPWNGSSLASATRAHGKSSRPGRTKALRTARHLVRWRYRNLAPRCRSSKASATSRAPYTRFVNWLAKALRCFQPISFKHKQIWAVSMFLHEYNIFWNRQHLLRPRSLFTNITSVL